MNKKYIVVLCDGMADYAIGELENGTPMSVAKMPNTRLISEKSEIGLVRTVPKGMKPGSDTANLSVIGYSPLKYYTGRSPIEAVSLGITLEQGDVCMRANLVTLSDEQSYEDKKLLDYGAGEISTEEAEQLIDAVKKELKLDNLYAGISYRHCLVLHNTTTGTKLTPPHDITGKPIAEYLPNGVEGELCLSLMKKSYDVLSVHPINIKRVQEGKNPANSLWFWGEGTKPALPDFKQTFGVEGGIVCAVDLIKGIGKLANMQVANVEGATGNEHTDYQAKAKAAFEMLCSGADYVYVHIEAPDECGHKGDCWTKIDAIEQIDSKVIGYLTEQLAKNNMPYSMMILPDHPTPCSTKTHASDPVPFLLFDSQNEKKNPYPFTENGAAESGNFVKRGTLLIRKLLGLPITAEDNVDENAIFEREKKIDLENEQSGVTMQDKELEQPIIAEITQNSQENEKALQEQQTQVTEEQPQEQVTEEQPQEQATEEQPKEQATEEQPQEQVTEEQPKEQATEEQPQEQATEEQPQEQATEEQPKEQVTEEQPQEQATEEQPQEQVTEEQPQEQATEEQPKEQATEEQPPLPPRTTPIKCTDYVPVFKINVGEPKDIDRTVMPVDKANDVTQLLESGCKLLKPKSKFAKFCAKHKGLVATVITLFVLLLAATAAHFVINANTVFVRTAEDLLTAQKGTKLQLMNDVIVNEDVNLTRAYEVDLNNHTLTINGDFSYTLSDEEKDIYIGTQKIFFLKTNYLTAGKIYAESFSFNALNSTLILTGEMIITERSELEEDAGSVFEINAKLFRLDGAIDCKTEEAVSAVCNTDVNITASGHSFMDIKLATDKVMELSGSASNIEGGTKLKLHDNSKAKNIVGATTVYVYESAFYQSITNGQVLFVKKLNAPHDILVCQQDNKVIFTASAVANAFGYRFELTGKEAVEQQDHIYIVEGLEPGKYTISVTAYGEDREQFLDSDKKESAFTRSLQLTSPKVSVAKDSDKLYLVVAEEIEYAKAIAYIINGNNYEYSLEGSAPYNIDITEQLTAAAGEYSIIAYAISDSRDTYTDSERAMATYVNNVQLSSPVLDAANDSANGLLTISWQKVDNARGYLVQVNGKVTYIARNDYQIEYEPATDIEIKVTALGVSYYLNSAEVTRNLSASELAVDFAENATVETVE